MKYISTICLLFTIMVFFSGCKKDDSNPAADTNQFTNKLTLGTGADATKFAITGETSTFTKTGANVMIYWRLETANDMGGSAVQIKVEKLVSGSYVAYNSFNFPSTQTYGHIMMSIFVMTEAGSYKATGILTTGNVTIASQTFTVI